MLRENLAGRKIGDWTVSSECRSVIDNGVSPRKRAYWNCTCVCGKQKWVLASSLIEGISRSCGCSKTIEFGLAARRDLFRTYVKSAKRRDFDFSISFDDFIAIAAKPCTYCGRPPGFTKRVSNSTGEFLYNGIDRVDSNVGYVLENCVSCCRHCNIAKNDLTTEQFRTLIKEIYLNFVKGESRDQ